jgi:hypothetical protein
MSYGDIVLIFILSREISVEGAPMEKKSMHVFNVKFVSLL